MNKLNLWLKRISFGLAALLTCALMAATLVEKTCGSDVASQFIYRSPAVITLWGVMAAAGLLYTIRCGMHRHPMTLTIHLALALILAGALTTHLTGIQGSVHLRQGEEPLPGFLTERGDRFFPFEIALEEFELVRYPGTHTPMDFVSRISVRDTLGGQVRTGTVSMNRIFRHRYYRFYQSAYDDDGRGTTLTVSYDPWGIALTYTGYALLLVGMLGFFGQRGSRFRRLLRQARTAATLLLVALATSGAQAATKDSRPQTLPEETAERMGTLYIYYNGRICPLQTVARDFTVKLCGRDTWRGLTAEQVLTGWFFHYDDWKDEPMIRIKDKRMQRLLGISGDRARITDFIAPGGYKLDEALMAAAPALRQAAEEANEKFTLVSMLCAGSLLHIYPVRTDGSEVTWYSPADKLPADTPEEQWIFVRSSLNYVAEMVFSGRYADTERVVDKIRRYQQREADSTLPSDARFHAERLYNRLGCNRLMAMLSVALGLLAFGLYLRSLVTDRPTSHRLRLALTALMGALLTYLVVMIALRGYVSGHAPLTNGHETMMFMSACSAVLSLAFSQRSGAALSFGFLVCGLTLMVAMLGEANPQITLLMPVLQSPLLSVHVVVIMTAYSLLAFTMLNGLTALLLRALPGRDRTAKLEQLQTVSHLLLYPAVFLLAAGIFIGAVWANVSWGRYWGWDPKEVWALITLLVYAAALHTASLPALRRPMVFHTFCVAAFLTVLITYFGVNFLLGGMHSYGG